MNTLLIGTADFTDLLLHTRSPFLVIDDGDIADAFLAHFPKAKLFDVKRNSFNPLKGMDYKRARDFAEIVYTASPQGGNTLTVRNGKRALTKQLLTTKTLDDIDRSNEEVAATIDDLLISPVLTRVLCGKPNFFFKGSVVAKLNRAQLGDFDAFVLASLLIQQHQGQIIVPDFGFYGRDFYMSLIRQERLTAKVNFLDELPPKLQNALLLIKDKTGRECLFDDAQTLARYDAGYSPATVGHGEFVSDLTDR